VSAPREIRLDEAEHVYTLNGVRVKSVTEIIRGMVRFAGARPEDVEAAADRGKAADRAVEIIANGRALEPSSVHPSINPYIAAFKAFLVDNPGFRCIETQVRVSHVGLLYCGTLDIFGRLRPAGKNGVFDVKCTATCPLTVGPQTAGYAGAIAEEFGFRFQDLDRYALWLRRDGTYRLVPQRSANDWHVFCSALTLTRWCDANGIKL